MCGGFDASARRCIESVLQSGVVMNSIQTNPPSGSPTSFIDAANQSVTANGVRFAYRDQGPTPRAFLRQLKAITAWGKQPPQDLGRLRAPTLVVNGDTDIMVPSVNSFELARRIPNAELVIYQDAGHGGIFQHHVDFVAKAQAFLDA
jgi:pimeloyl-ACP methyl ester carboxylesterase